MKPQNTVALVNYVLSYMPYTTELENKLTLFFLGILIFTEKDQFTISTKSIGTGGFSLVGSQNKRKSIHGLDLSRDEILIGIEEINDRGILEITEVYGHKDLIHVRLNLLANITHDMRS